MKIKNLQLHIDLLQTQVRARKKMRAHDVLHGQLASFPEKFQGLRCPFRWMSATLTKGTRLSPSPPSYLEINHFLGFGDPKQPVYLRNFIKPGHQASHNYRRAEFMTSQI